MRRCFALVAVATAIGLLASTCSASAIGYADFVYYQQGPWQYDLCAKAGNDLSNQGGDAQMLAHTYSGGGTNCGTPVNSADIRVATALLKKSGGSWVACGPNFGSIGPNAWWAPVDVTKDFCGSAEYSAATGHTVLMAGTYRHQFLNTGSIWY